MPDVHIGKNCIIAVGSLILKDVSSGSVVAGVPAKQIGTFDEIHQKRIDEGRKLGSLNQKELEAHVWSLFNQKIGKTE